jgi:mannan endo-1,4-beta-mannosidase
MRLSQALRNISWLTKGYVMNLAKNFISAFSVLHLRHLLALCLALLVAGELAAAPLKVVGRFLQDTHGNNIQMRGVNLPVYKSGYADDLDAVAAAIARTKSNAVRLEWWAVPSPGTTEYTLANFDRAIQKFYDLGIIPVVELHDLTFQYGHDAKLGPLSDGNDRAIFANTITAFWTRADILAILLKHQDHLVINLANEWGSSDYSDGTPTTTNFVQNYTDAIMAMRSAGIVAPLMVDAPKGFEYPFLFEHGQALLAADPLHNTLLSIHTYWAASAFADDTVNTILDDIMNSGLPIVLGEVSSNAYTDIPCDVVHYANLFSRANANAIGYLFWAWYEDGTCGQLMNITVGSSGYDALYHPAFGIDAAQPPTRKADFSPVNEPALLNTSFGYNVTSSDDNVQRTTTAQVTRLSSIGAEKRPVVLLMPGWSGTGNVASARDAQATLLANNGYVAMNIGFHQTNSGAWYSDLAESAKAALDTLCVQPYADCSAVLLIGESYGGTQTHPVVRYLRANAVYDGSAGANSGRQVLGILGQDSGYSYYWQAPQDADATAYSIAMIENLGDADFPVDSCEYGNCGARNRADYHQRSTGSQYVLSYCPPGGTHGSRGYTDWDAWVLSAVKTMLHKQRGASKFSGYVEPTLAVSNACLSNPASVPDAPVVGTITAGRQQVTVSFAAPAHNGGSPITGYTVTCRAAGQTPRQGNRASSPITVSALAAGATYSCSIIASNSIGNSIPSPDFSVVPQARTSIAPILLILLD